MLDGDIGGLQVQQPRGHTHVNTYCPAVDVCLGRCTTFFKVCLGKHLILKCGVKHLLCSSDAKAAKTRSMVLYLDLQKELSSVKESLGQCQRSIKRMRMSGNN